MQMMTLTRNLGLANIFTEPFLVSNRLTLDRSLQPESETPDHSAR
jgi:hypothetical protein